MDQFIGEVAFWNRGIGTDLVSAMSQHLLRECNAQRVVMDPHVTNHRAVRCYEKCGFCRVRVLREHELHEGEMRDCWLMELQPPFAVGERSCIG